MDIEDRTRTPDVVFWLIVHEERGLCKDKVGLELSRVVYMGSFLV